MVGRPLRGVLSFEASLAFLVGVLMDSLFREERRGRQAGGRDAFYTRPKTSFFARRGEGEGFQIQGGILKMLSNRAVYV